MLHVRILYRKIKQSHYFNIGTSFDVNTLEFEEGPTVCPVTSLGQQDNNS